MQKFQSVLVKKRKDQEGILVYNLQATLMDRKTPNTKRHSLL